MQFLFSSKFKLNVILFNTVRSLNYTMRMSKVNRYDSNSNLIQLFKRSFIPMSNKVKICIVIHVLILQRQYCLVSDMLAIIPCVSNRNV